jgi:hypothetical protein
MYFIFAGKKWIPWLEQSIYITGTLELKEIGSNFNTGAITTTYPQYSDHHHSKNPAVYC